MKSRLTLLLLFACCQIQAQSSFLVRNGCAVDNTEMGRNHYVFDPSIEAQRIIKLITDANFLEPNFAIKSGDVDNALATFDGGERYILYNTAYIERIKASEGSDWAAFFVFAHEIGHHLNNHRFDLTDNQKQKEQELQADVFAGGMLYRLGGSLEAAQGGVLSACREQETSTHPPRRARLEAVASGWKRAKEQSPVQPQRVRITLDEPITPVKTDNMVLIKSGSFQMGSNDGSDNEKPIHTVTVSDFYLSKYEVTVAEFRAFINDSGYVTDAEKEGNSYGYDGTTWKSIDGRNWRHDTEGNTGQDDHPVVNVSWNDAVAYCDWMSKKTGKMYRLPTEAEWEYAAGNGYRHTKYSWGNGDPSGKTGGSLRDESSERKFNWGSIFEGYDDGYATTAPVGSFNKNDFDLFDMTGNVWEWCSDWYGSDYYKTSPSGNPKGPDSGSYRVIRGGSWNYSPQSCRVANRYFLTPGNRNYSIGFRLARTK